MRKLKFFVYSALLTLVLIIIGELYVFDLDSFQNQYINASFSVNQMSDTKKTKEDFLNSAQVHSLGIFTVDTSIIGREKTYNIYGNPKALEDLKKVFKQDTYFSLPIGTAKLVFYDFNDIENLDLMGDIYFSNPREDLATMRDFKKDLINQYGGGFPNDYGVSNTFTYTQLGLYFIIFALLGFLTYLDLQYQRSESLIRLIHGEDLVKAKLRSLLRDLGLIILVTSLVFLILSRFYYLDFTLPYLICGVTFYSILGLVLNLKEANIDIRKALMQVREKNKLIGYSSFFKLLSMIIFAKLIYQNLILIKNGLDYRSQEPYFQSISDHDYYRLNYRIGNSLNKDVNSTDDSAKVHRDFNEKFYDRSLLMFNLTPASLSSKSIILANSQALKVRL